MEQVQVPTQLVKQVCYMYVTAARALHQPTAECPRSPKSAHPHRKMSQHLGQGIIKSHQGLPTHTAECLKRLRLPLQMLGHFVVGARLPSKLKHSSGLCLPILQVRTFVESFQPSPHHLGLEVTNLQPTTHYSTQLSQAHIRAGGLFTL